MKKSILEIYALLVCFSFLTAGGACVVDIIDNAFNYYVPTATAYDNAMYLNNSAFCATNAIQCYSDFDESTQKGKNRFAEDIVTQHRKEVMAENVKSTQARAIVSALKSLIYLPLCALVFYFHWQVARRSREAK
ncbi:MAG TPA: hypothetical protein VFR09_03515 [Alphaproteobacteria bacterium]|nr:hypothetical protein [Alphaproteobacteria bacterium]